MPILRINQHPGMGPNQFRIEVSVSGIPGFQVTSFSRNIEFVLSQENGERIRWYLEDYLQFYDDPAPQIAKSIEVFMDDCGDTLFQAIFEGLHQGLLLWGSVEPYLSSTRIEITTGIAEATAIPWELIRNPHTKRPLALSAQAFVRTQRVTNLALLPQAVGKVRILLIICRPRGAQDVPFRSVAGRLVMRLQKENPNAFELDVLRPPTFERLALVLDIAKERRRPYHIVHFDGHGGYAAGIGFLVFEKPGTQENIEKINGFQIGALLKDSSVPFLLLNACQSAFAQARAEPVQDVSAETRIEVEAYGSLAQAVIEAGVGGVVAMRYSVFVVTAVQFVEHLYGALARGRTLGDAVTSARKMLAINPERRIAYVTRLLQDWCVPVVWEQHPLQLWPEDQANHHAISLEDGAASYNWSFDPAFPERPDIGFYGRDETLYALDRAFDSDPIVLLHAYAGSGKTATAAEFARWYTQTGGVVGPIIYTSFERHTVLARVLDKIGTVFKPILERNNIHWEALDLASRRDAALQILSQEPVFWIWDNVELVAGFPQGAPSAWSRDEQQELRDFLSAARETKAKFLITSRRNETSWLGNLPRRIAIPPMPMQERFQLAAAVSKRGGKDLAELPNLTSLLHFTGGNPLTIIVAIATVLSRGLLNQLQVDALVNALRVGEDSFDDEEIEGRSKSLGASLSYGFNNAFDETEIKIIAALYLFQGQVFVASLQYMFDSNADLRIKNIGVLTRERAIKLLDRAAALGLLENLCEGHYRIHPALPWFLKRLFEQHYRSGTRDAEVAVRAFVEAEGALGRSWHKEYQTGYRFPLSDLTGEEDNLLAAWGLAREHNWLSALVCPMLALWIIYIETGRPAPWRKLVSDTIPYFVDPTTDGPFDGREQEWSFINQWRVYLAHDQRDSQEAERLQRIRFAWDRERALSASSMEPETWSNADRKSIQSYAVSLHLQGDLLRSKGDPACVDQLFQSINLFRKLGDPTRAAIGCLNLGRAYMELVGVRDLDEAERWTSEAIRLIPPSDALTLGRGTAQKGQIFLERFVEARAGGRPNEELLDLLNKAVIHYGQALETMPENAFEHRAACHERLGVIYTDGNEFLEAAKHFQQGIQLYVRAGNIWDAGRTRASTAKAYRAVGQLGEARLYAKAALADFENFGANAKRAIQEVELLINEIDAVEGKRP